MVSGISARSTRHSRRTGLSIIFHVSDLVTLQAERLQARVHPLQDDDVQDRDDPPRRERVEQAKQVLRMVREKQRKYESCQFGL